MEQEKAIFGFYLVNHPTTNYYRDNKECIRLNDIKKYFMKQIHILVLVERIKFIKTKKGERMAFVTGSDETGIMDFTLFPKILRMYPDIARGDILKVRGIVERRLDEWQMVGNRIEKLNGEENEKG